MNLIRVSRRGAEEAETAEGFCLRRSRFQIAPALEICSSKFQMSLRLKITSLRSLLPLRLCANQKPGIKA